MLCPISREDKKSSTAETAKENAEEKKIHQQELARCTKLMEMLKELSDITLNALTLGSNSMSAVSTLKSEANERSNYHQDELLRYTKLGK